MVQESHLETRHGDTALFSFGESTPSSYLDVNTRSLIMWVVFFTPIVLAAFLIFAIILLPVKYT